VLVTSHSRISSHPEGVMHIRFDHTIVPSTDKAASAAYYTEVFGLPPAREEAPFLALDLGNDVAFCFAGWDREVAVQHYAFLVSEADFDGIYGRLRERGQDHWADAHARKPGEINHDDGGRGVYFRDPDGHWLEVITVRYGGRPSTV